MLWMDELQYPCFPSLHSGLPFSKCQNQPPKLHPVAVHESKQHSQIRSDTNDLSALESLAT